MDREYQRRLISDGFSHLQERREAEGWDIEQDLAGLTTFVRLYGAGGKLEPLLVKVEAAQYPIGPWRVGFIDPGVEGDRRLWVPDRDPRYWPMSHAYVPGLLGGFHVSYAGPFRVFICRPFTTEFFYYHPEYPWQPDYYTLDQVVAELRKAVKQALHFTKWCAAYEQGGP